MSSPRFSIIIPVYNRPEEVDDLLSGLVHQTNRDFEVIVVEDGSQLRCDLIVDKYRDKLDIRYIFKQNSGPGPSRNVGFTNARGAYFVVFDSDCIIPPTYFQAVDQSLATFHWDAWGGPDKAHENFTTLQRAMGHTMSSLLTTGGIRGGKKRIGAFQPRSFNMGLSRKVFETTGGFSFTHFAEDIELSIRMKNAGFNVGLIPEAFVYHKRRTNFEQFYKQVFNFGKGRALLGKIHRHEIKLTHWFPAVFLMGTILLIFLPWFSIPLFVMGGSLFLVYLAAVFAYALAETKNLAVAALSVPAALLQLWGYGAGFLSTVFKKNAPK